jgi:hypothetical protein
VGGRRRRWACSYDQPREGCTVCPGAPLLQVVVGLPNANAIGSRRRNAGGDPDAARSRHDGHDGASAVRGDAHHNPVTQAQRLGGVSHIYFACTRTSTLTRRAHSTLLLAVQMAIVNRAELLVAFFCRACQMPHPPTFTSSHSQHTCTCTYTYTRLHATHTHTHTTHAQHNTTNLHAHVHTRHTYTHTRLAAWWETQRCYTSPWRWGWRWGPCR